MEVQGVDPRDIEWEADATVYRVYFWSPNGGTCDEYELSGVGDVCDVLDWAESQRSGRVPEIFARHDTGGRTGVIRLSGGRPGRNLTEP